VTLHSTSSFSDNIAAHHCHAAGRLSPLRDLLKGIFQSFHFCADFMTRPHSTLVGIAIACQRVVLYNVQQCVGLLPDIGYSAQCLLEKAREGELVGQHLLPLRVGAVSLVPNLPRSL